MEANAAGPAPLPGISLETWIVRFDKHGGNTSPDTPQVLLDRLAATPDSPVIVFSHGWNNNDKYATERYAKFLANLQTHFSTHGGSARPPIFVGLRWPSMWFPFDKAPAAAGMANAEAVGLAQLKEELAEELLEADRRRFRALADLPRLSESEVGELADLFGPSLQSLGAADIEGAEASGIDRKSLLATLQALQADRDSPADGGAVRGKDWYVDTLFPLRVLSVFVMKNRAGMVGRQGVSRLVRDILRKSRGPLHLIGHSYGAKVVLAAVAAQSLPRKVDSLLLLQPAISYLCFAEKVPERGLPGAYRIALSRTAGSVAATFSRWDSSLHWFYHRIMWMKNDPGELDVAAEALDAAGAPPNRFAALGGYGPRDAGEILVSELPMPGTATPALREECLIAFDGSLGERISGHGDVSNTYTAWLLHQQMKKI
ncbi:MAG: hypothetical protein H3C26_09970 [Rhodocyclaceae bacterium]|nr:hypothetical protein [Rhodocyclaceae bacterium]